MIWHMKKELNRGEEYHNGVGTLIVQLLHCRHFCNTLSRQRHALHHSTAPSQLNDRYYLASRLPSPTRTRLTGVPTTTSKFPVSLRHPTLSYTGLAQAISRHPQPATTVKTS
ncbi:hypothetical protein J6590_056860 [Homalodisca vitripennis]|nr:hypothetical protein J6590_056860 [Homalodisca vitripennis]